MKSKPNAAIIDIDNVLANSFRKEFIEQFNSGDFSVFEALIPTYSANAWCVKLVNSISKDMEILFVTARDSTFRDATIAWLDDKLDTSKIYSKNLYMRPAGDTGTDSEVKRELYELFKDDYNILFAIDDNLDNCRLWQSLGIPALTNTISEE
jgi:hypothetical protein